MPYLDPMPTNEATARQIDLIKKLVPQLSDKLAKAGDHANVARVNQTVANMQAELVKVLRGDAVDLSVASGMIGFLIDCDKMLDAATDERKLTEHPGIVGAKRIITNRFAKDCFHCGETVAAGEGFAASYGYWRTICATCADSSPEVLKAKAQAVTDAKRAIADADRAERNARRVLAAKIKRVSATIIRQAGCDDLDRPKVRVAIDSPRPDQDFDFYIVNRDNIFRYLGGQGIVSLSGAEQFAAAKRILTSNVKQAMQIFGTELGECGRCGKSLTDEQSRARGLGPDCYAVVYSGGSVVR